MKSLNIGLAGIVLTTTLIFLGCSGNPNKDDEESSSGNSSSSDTLQPWIHFNQPTDGETSFPIDAPIFVAFSEDMDQDSTESASGISPSNSADFRWYGGDEMEFIPSPSLEYNTHYEFWVNSSATDLSGSPLTRDYRYEFTTESPPELEFEPEDPSSLLALDGFKPNLSPDGNKVAFLRLYSSSDREQSDIWVMNANGTGETRLTNTPNDSESSIQWYPDGTRISFLRSPSPNYFDHIPGSVFDMYSDGSDETKRVDASQIETVEFVNHAESDNPTKYIFREGSVDLTKQLGGWPDLIAWVLKRNEGEPIKNLNSYYSSNESYPPIVMNGFLNNILLWNPYDSLESEVSSEASFPYPSFSPSGERIIAGSNGGLPFGLYLMDLNGENLEQITSEKDYQPTWVGSNLVFVRVPDGGSITHGNIYRIAGFEEE